MSVRVIGKPDLAQCGDPAEYECDLCLKRLPIDTAPQYRLEVGLGRMPEVTFQHVCASCARLEKQAKTSLGKLLLRNGAAT